MRRLRVGHVGGSTVSSRTEDRVEVQSGTSMPVVVMYTNVYVKINQHGLYATSLKHLIIGCVGHIKLLLHISVYGVCQTMALIKMMAVKCY